MDAKMVKSAGGVVNGRFQRIWVVWGQQQEPLTPPPGADVPEIRSGATGGGMDFLANSAWWVHGLDRPRLIGLSFQRWYRGPWPATLPTMCQSNTEMLATVVQRGPANSGICPACNGMVPYRLVIFGNVRSVSGMHDSVRCMDCGSFVNPAPKPGTSAHAQMAHQDAWNRIEKRLLSLPCVDT